MRKKYWILVFIVIFNISAALAIEHIVIDTVSIRCLYTQTQLIDTLNRSSAQEGTFLLQIGKYSSKFFDYDKFLSDSVNIKLIRENRGAGQLKLMLPPGLREKLKIYKGYPKSKITCTTYFAFEYYKWEEVVEVPKWELQKDTLTVCGNLCRKATAFFRGRSYVAWYAEEIPISDGPWKFTGLPGLILKINDTRGQIGWECIAIEKMSRIDEIYYDKGLNEVATDRKKIEKEKVRYHESPGAYMEGNPLIDKRNTPSANAYKKRPYNPIELDWNK